MIILKPAWVHHEDNKPVFSIDIHPKGNRFATGGQGDSGGRIIIWNITPVLKEKDESDKAIPKMLCQMDNHLACVNVVRWSSEGHLLASGGDDKLVMIWRLTSEGSSSVFGSRKINVETWKCVHTLNSHSGDVLDLAWAPHDGWLASSSVDNTVIIWNAHKFPEKISVLKGHTGMVKGVTWDPVGKYIASQSDDKSLRIWRTEDWTQDQVVTDPFTECSATTHVLRLSWSPDGQYLVSAHAMNGGGPTAQIIERDGWKQDKDFVGHRKAITCVRFNSNILKKQSSDNNKSHQYCCCAIGSRDRSVSVWLTSLKRPLVVIKDLFDDSVLDISWSSDGLYLLACSWDGTIACIVFSPKELGIPLTLSEKNDLYEKIYHKSFQRNWNTSFSGSQVIENPEFLKVISETVQEEKVIIPEPVQVNSTNSSNKEVIFESPKLSNSVLVPANKQVETRLPSGKRRITPMLLTTAPTSTAGVTTDSIKSNLEAPVIEKAFSTSSATKSQIIIETTSSKPQKPEFIPPSTSTSQNNESSIILQPPGIHITQLQCSDVPGDQPIVQFIPILDPLKFPNNMTVTKQVGHIKIQITNSCHKTSKGALARIDVFSNNNDKQPSWDTYLGAPIRCIAANKKFIIACCEDLTINIYEIKSGGRPLPPLLIDDLVSSLNLSRNNFCLVLTKTGLMYMWDLNTSKCVLTRISLRSLLNNKGMVNNCYLSDSNSPVVTLNDGRAFSYNMNLQSWIVLSNPLDPLTRASGMVARKAPSNLPLACLQRSMPLHGSNDTLPSGVFLSFLEFQISSSLELRSPIEYKHWLFKTVDHLLEKGPESRLRLILDDLIKPLHLPTAKRARTDDTILGISKQLLLKEILSIIKAKLPWQRIYKEYYEQMSQIMF